MREDYTNSQIFSYTLFSLLGSLAGLWLANTWIPELSFFLTILFFIGSSYFLLKHLSIKFFEYIDGFAISLFYFFLFFRAGQFLDQVSYLSFGLNFTLILFILHMIVPIICISCFKYFLKNYRRFSWYPSGKIGFAGLTSLVIFLLFQAMLRIGDLIINPNLIFNIPYLPITSQILEVIGLIGLCLGFVFVVYLRSGRR